MPSFLSRLGRFAFRRRWLVTVPVVSVQKQVRA